MSYQSFFTGCVQLVLALTVLYLVVEYILDRYHSTAGGSMWIVYLGFVSGVIYTLIAVSISVNWSYPVRIVAGLLVGVPVAWAIMICTSLLVTLLYEISAFLHLRRG
jgi:hypothetical protein